MVLMVVENYIGILSTVICNDYFFEKAPEDLPQTIYGIRIIEFSGLINLWQKVSCTLYGTGNQQWKIADKQ